MSIGTPKSGHFRGGGHFRGVVTLEGVYFVIKELRKNWDRPKCTTLGGWSL